MNRRVGILAVLFFVVAIGLATWAGCTGDIKNGTHGSIWLALRIETFSIFVMFIATACVAFTFASLIDTNSVITTRMLQIVAFIFCLALCFGYSWSLIVYSEMFSTKSCFSGT